MAEAEIDLLLPVLNEADALPWVLGRVPAGVHCIVVDNGSTDNSAEVARSWGATVVSEPLRGFGAACAAGLAAATADIVAFCDADASLDPSELRRITDPVRGGDADLVLGARTTDSWRAFLPHARMANAYLAHRLRVSVGAQITDLGPMRAARRDGLLALGIEDLRFGWPLEMVIRAGHAGWRILEVPVAYRPRVGRSKVTGTLSGTAKAVSDMRAVLGDMATGGPRP